MCTEYGRNEMQRIVEFVSCQFVKVDWSPTLAELKLGRRRQALEGCEPKANKSSFSFSESEGLGLSDLRYRRTTTIETHVVMKLLVMMKYMMGRVCSSRGLVCSSRGRKRISLLDILVCMLLGI